MMKQKRIVAVALGLALSVSPMIMLPTAFADQVSGNPSSSISARSTAPNPLDKFSTAEKAFLNNHKDEIASALGIDRFDPSTTDYFGQGIGTRHDRGQDPHLEHGTAEADGRAARD